MPIQGDGPGNSPLGRIAKRLEEIAAQGRPVAALGGHHLIGNPRKRRSVPDRIGNPRQFLATLNVSVLRLRSRSIVATTA